MKALALVGPRRFKEIEINKPDLDPHAVLVKVKIVGICGSDLHYVREPKDIKAQTYLQRFRGILPSSISSKMRFLQPKIIGHEISGTIESVGDKVRNIEKGTRVSANPNIYCEICQACKTEYENLCFQDKGLGWGGYQGALAEFVKVPAKNLISVPPQISDEEAATLDCIAVPLHAAKLGEVSKQHTVVILGAGTIGLLLLQVLKSFGVNDIAITDVSDFNLRLAKEFGARYTFNAFKFDVCEKIKKLLGRVDRVFECVGGSAPTLEQAFSIINFHGKIVIVGRFTSPKVIPSKFFMNEVNMVASSRYLNSEFQESLELLVNKALRVKPLITHIFPVSRINEAFETALRKKETNAIKVQIMF